MGEGGVGRWSERANFALDAAIVLLILVQPIQDAPVNPFQLRPGSGKPIYAQLVDQVEYAVAAGLLAPGDRLPTVRELAAELVVNVNTVARAYRDLEQAGVIETSPGRGSFVAERSAPEADRFRKLEPHIDRLVEAARKLGYEPEELMTLVEQKARSLGRAKR